MSFGAHFSLKSMSQANAPRFDEFKIQSALESQLVANGGNVESYSLVASTVSTQFRSPGREPVSEQLLGIGLSPTRSRVKNLQFTAIGKETLNTMMRDEVWFPEAILDRPLGKGTKRYGFEDVTDMLYDLEPYSGFEEPYDPISILSGRPNADKTISGEVINMIVPQAFTGEIIQNIGDYFTYCMSSPSSKKFGEMRYAPESCQIKFKARAVASFNKMPGFPKMTGYKSALQLGPSLLATDNQVSSVVNRMVATFPEF